MQVAHEHPHLIEAKQLWEVRIGEMLISMRDRDMTTLKAQVGYLCGFCHTHTICSEYSLEAMQW